MTWDKVRGGVLPCSVPIRRKSQSSYRLHRRAAAVVDPVWRKSQKKQILKSPCLSRSNGNVEVGRNTANPLWFASGSTLTHGARQGSFFPRRLTGRLSSGRKRIRKESSRAMPMSSINEVEHYLRDIRPLLSRVSQAHKNASSVPLYIICTTIPTFQVCHVPDLLLQ